MTVHSDFDVFDHVAQEQPAKPPAATDGVVDTYWGYIVKCAHAPSYFLMISQAVSWLIGAALLVAALGLWMISPTLSTGGDFGMKLGATVLALSSASLCLWYSSRGTQSEIQIDTRLGEVREVVRNRAGRSTLVARYGFDAIGSVFIDLGGRKPRADDVVGNLVLRYRNTSQTMHVATGSLAQLGKLRDRLGHDLMIAPKTTARMPVPTPTFEMQAA